MATQYAFDSETTGLHSKEGDRIIELAFVEITRDPNPRYFHTYLNPGDREISAEAQAVHQITQRMVEDAPTFEEVLPQVIEFLGDDAELVIHNAAFDLEFVRDECARCDQAWPEYAYIDTLKEAAKQFPGARHSLDALCTRFNVDTSSRVAHGALIDTRILANLFLAWFGQAGFSFDVKSTVIAKEDIIALGAMNDIIVPVPETEPAVTNAQAWEALFGKHAI